VRVRKIAAGTGIMTTIAGTGGTGTRGDGGPATAARLYSVTDVAVDAAGNVFIADPADGRVRRVDAVTGLIETRSPAEALWEMVVPRSEHSSIRAASPSTRWAISSSRTRPRTVFGRFR
jgi:hypothetical protein